MKPIKFVCLYIYYWFCKDSWWGWSPFKTSYIDHSSYSTCLQKDNGDKFEYGGWWSVWWTGTYSMVLSKAAFFHKKYFSLYTKEMPASIKDYITKNRFVLLTN